MLWEFKFELMCSFPFGEIEFFVSVALVDMLTILELIITQKKMQLTSFLPSPNIMISLLIGMAVIILDLNWTGIIKTDSLTSLCPTMSPKHLNA